MAKLNVNPTRMEMSNLKRRLATSTRGHKLLKDKQDELMRQFIELIRKNKALREDVERELSESFQDFLLASAMMSPAFMEQAVSYPSQKVEVDIRQQNVMSVLIPKMEFKRSSGENQYLPYGFAQTSAELDDALEKLQKVLDRMLELAQLEKTAQLMAGEIEKTRRRVNALEYRTIPDLQETIKWIRMKLDENDRATITRLMKVKQLIAQED